MNLHYNIASDVSSVFTAATAVLAISARALCSLVQSVNFDVGNVDIPEGYYILAWWN